MGFFIKDMAGVPRIIIEFLEEQLDLNEAPDLSGYPYLIFFSISLHRGQESGGKIC